LTGGFKGFVDIPCNFNGGARPFFAIEVDPHKGPPSEVAQMLTEHYRSKENQEMEFAFVFVGPVTEDGKLWINATAKAWARQFVDGHCDLLARMVDEETMSTQGWPVAQLPIFGRIRFLAFASFGGFKEVGGNMRPLLDAEGLAILKAFRGQVVVD
jgi:hypothetical protein